MGQSLESSFSSALPTVQGSSICALPVALNIRCRDGQFPIENAYSIKILRWAVSYRKQWLDSSSLQKRRRLFSILMESCRIMLHLLYTWYTRYNIWGVKVKNWLQHHKIYLHFLTFLDLLFNFYKDTCTCIVTPFSKKKNATFLRIPFFWRRVYVSETGVIQHFGLFQVTSKTI